MDTAGKGRSDKAMILIPAGVLLFMMTLMTGGPRQFVQVLNYELRAMAGTITGWVSLWF